MNQQARKSIRAVLAEPADPTDRELVWAMVAMLVLEVAAAAYVGVTGVRRGLPVFVVAAEAAPPLLQGIPLLRARYSRPAPYSVGGVFWLLITVSASIVWTLAVIIVSAVTGWWAHGEPVTFEVSVAVGLLPLALGIWRLSAKVRALGG